MSYYNFWILILRNLRTFFNGHKIFFSIIYLKIQIAISEFFSKIKKFILKWNIFFSDDYSILVITFLKENFIFIQNK